MNIHASTTSLGIQPLAWNAFSVATASSAYSKIAAPSFVVTKLTSKLGAASAGASKLILVVGSGVLPAWAIPGAAVKVNVTLGGVPFIMGAVISDTTSTTVTLAVSSAQCSISTAYTNQNLDAVAGTVVNTVTLQIQAQKAMFQVQTGQSGNVNLAPVADANGANPPYFITLTPGGGEYEVTAQPGSKFDLADWWVQSSAGTPNLTVRFL